MDMALVSFLKKTAEEQVPGQSVVTPNLPPAVTTWEEEGSRGNWRRRSSKAPTFRMVYLLSTTTTVDYSLVCLMIWDSLVFATGLLRGFWVVLVFVCVCVCFFLLAAVAMANSSVVAVGVWWVLLLCCYSQNVEQEFRRRILFAKGEELGVV